MSDKKPHPIGTMQPSDTDMQRMLVTLAWYLRENAGACERHLDDDSVEVLCPDLASPGQVRAMAETCAHLAQSIGGAAADDSALLFAAAAGHFNAADAHLTTHLTYSALVGEKSSDKHTTDLYTDERTFAARAMKLGRQMAHRGLSKLVEAWPTSFEAET